MQKIIDKILEGNLDYENGSLDFSCAKIELSIRSGQQYEDSFRILVPDGLYTAGMVYSSDWRMECLTEEFSGEEEIAFRFHGEKLEEGDVVKGTFDVVSNRGEYYLPFVVSVEHDMPESSVGTVKNLFHFANLAKSSWKEAVKLFYSPEFSRIFSGSDARYLEDYRAFSACRGQEQNVEEFLIQVNKKQNAEFMAEEAELESQLPAFGPAGVMEQSVSIVRNGWGFTRLTVECDGEFLFTEKEVLTDDDFLGNRCRLPVFIDSGRLRRGRSFGRIRLYNAYTDLIIPVTVSLGGAGFADSKEAARMRCTARLMDFYQSFRLRKISTSGWLKETGKLVERLVALDESDISSRLLQAQLLITEERRNEAGWILDHAAETFEKQPFGDTLTAYYLYLTTLLHGDEAYVEKVAEDVARMFERDDSNWRIGWLLMYLSEDYCRSDREKWAFWETLFRKGCTSPVLYIEAVSLINANPSLLRRLGRFDQQVIWYGVRHGVLKQEAVEQTLYLAARVKEYSEALFQALSQLYGKRKDVQLLQEICTLLIKGAKVGPAWFDWYRAGVEAQLRITNLYEYFMMSLDLEQSQEIPKAVLKYFSYQNNMDYAHTAYLYDYIIQHQDRLEDVYEAYRFKIEYFVTEQIKKKHINRNLANLYNRLLRADMVNEQTAGPLSKLLFAHLIQVEDERLRKVYVYQPGNLQPSEYMLTDKRTWAAIYGIRYTIVFEDAEGNRFLKNVDYTMEKLMLPGKFLRWLLPMGELGLGLDFYLCGSESVCREEPDQRIKRELRIAASDSTDLQVKRELYLRILQYYYDTDDCRALDEYLKKIPSQELTALERATVIRFMVLRGNYRLAWEWLEVYGPYIVDVKILVRLAGAMIERYDMGENSLLTAAAVYIFRKGKYDSTILNYLSAHYQGMARNMREIWKAAKSFGADCYRLSERLLVQMLYSGAFVGEKMEIFRYYISQGPKQEVEEAFLAQCSYDYFVKERLVEKEVFHEIRQMYQRGEPVQMVCKLAYLKYFAENGQEEDSDSMVTELLEEMLEREIYLEFFREFGQCPGLERELCDKTIMEYRTKPQTEVCIHYTILDENGETEGYRSAYMREAYGGVCFKTFVLFFGECLQYYITEEREGKFQVTGSGTLQRLDNDAEEESRYQMINDIAMAQTMQDYDTMDQLLEEYYKKDFLSGRLFELK
ncbi:MAG: hypothetical protein HFH93_07780 [Lachnospiraceae bacterium]|nr:hypothetical protein [Lachnospiraceae bacterium]